MGYVHKDWRKPKHRWAKRTNFQNAIDLPEDALNGEMSRYLANYEWAELREICQDKGLPDPTDRTLGAFITTAGRCPQYYANGRWITPPPIQSGPGTMTASPDGAHRHPEHESKLLTTGIRDNSTKDPA